MSVLSTTRRHVGATAVGAVAVLALAGGGSAAYAASSGPSAPPSPAPKPPAHGHHHSRGLAERSDHATVEVKAKGQWVTYTIDRGKVASVSAASITLARPDGQSVTISLTPTTKYHGVSGASAIQTGKGARVVSQNGSAVGVSQRGAKTPPATPGSTPAA